MVPHVDSVTAMDPDIVKGRKKKAKMSFEKKQHGEEEKGGKRNMDRWMEVSTFGGVSRFGRREGKKGGREGVAQPSSIRSTAFPYPSLHHL